MYRIALWLGLSFGAIQAKAAVQQVNSSTTDIGQVSRRISTDAPVIDLELHASQYIDQGQPTFRDGASGSNTSYMFRTAGSLYSTVQLKWDLESEYSGTENFNYLRPRELYVRYEGFSFGRRKMTYSNWEDQWGQSLFEPRFMDDKLHNSKGGLIGVFVEDQSRYVHWMVGFLPVYLPEFGPHYWIGNNAQFTSRNPWFHPPQSSFSYRDQNHQIDYSTAYPDVGKVITQPGGVAELDWKPSGQTSARLSYAYKPMTQMLLGFPLDGRFDLHTEHMEIELQPRFIYHQVANLDFNFTGEKNQIGVSVAGEHPVLDQKPSDWELQSVTDALIVSAYDNFALDPSKSWLVSGSILKVWGGDRPDKGDVQTTQTLFERRYQYTEAASLGLRKIWRISGLESGLKVIYDRLQNGLVYSGDLTVHVQKSFAVTAAFDLFHILPGTPEMPDGFIDVYRGNDRLSLGMSYVF